MTVVNEAFALRRYQTSNIGPITMDLASLVVELSKKESLYRRINPFSLRRVGDNVVCPDLGEQDVIN